MGLQLPYLAAAALLLSTEMATACDIGFVPKLPGAPPPIEIAADGSFGFEIWNSASYAYGRPARKVANDMTHQVIGRGLCATASEALFIIDCETGQALSIAGSWTRAGRAEVAELQRETRKKYGENAVTLGVPTKASRSLTVANLFSPEGDLVISPDMDIPQIFETARMRDLEVSYDINSIFGSLEPEQRYNPYTACRIHYPDSRGASL